ncbi:MAG: hypothetical protein EA389_05945 [Ilumatobacter sp.]|nr:MAG: hypothetical protein EA389_05945 [Ilumatobacter sp.]
MCPRLPYSMDGGERRPRISRPAPRAARPGPCRLPGVPMGRGVPSVPGRRRTRTARGDRPRIARRCGMVAGSHR